MSKLLFAIGMFWGSFVGIHHQPATSRVAQSNVATTKTPGATATIACSGSACSSSFISVSPSQNSFSPSHVPTTNIQLFDISQWVTYADSDDGITFTYPKNWESYSPPNAGPAVVAFKPNQTPSEALGGNKYCVAAAFLIFNYQAERQRILASFGKTYKQEPITIAHLSGVHLQSATSGYYLLNRDEKALEFSYLIINGKDYGQVAEHMAKSLIFLGK